MPLNGLVQEVLNFQPLFLVKERTDPCMFIIQIEAILENQLRMFLVVLVVVLFILLFLICCCL